MCSSDLPRLGRTFFGAHLAMERPTDPVLSGWHAVNCIREWRGDTHWAIVVAAGLDGARESSVYDSERIVHPGYDDFSETAFCCGGLYLAKRSLWNRVGQDESLYHCEWEDVTFGLECQRRGMPHRVNTFVTAESAVPHPMLLTRIHTRHAPGRIERGRVHADANARASVPSDAFKPVVGATRRRFVISVIVASRVPRRYCRFAELATGATCSR